VGISIRFRRFRLANLISHGPDMAEVMQQARDQAGPNQADDKNPGEQAAKGRPAGQRRRNGRHGFDIK
jgi:hypothetical protein